MQQSFQPSKAKKCPLSFHKLYQPIKRIVPKTPVLESRGCRPLKMTFEDQLTALIFFHLEEHVSARHMLQVLEEDDFARKNIAPEGGIKKSSFSEAINERGLEQLQFVFEQLALKASGMLPCRNIDFGELVALDGSLIDATLSMTWADYRKESKKAKAHVGFDLNKAIPTKMFLTDGKGAERPFTTQIVSPGQTVVGDRGCQKHALFDALQTEDKSFVIRIKANTAKTIIQKNDVNSDSIVFYDAEVLLGSAQNKKQTQKPLRLTGYRANGSDFWTATDRRDLAAEQIAEIYKLRWNIETFFAWWKRHLRVCHLIARSEYGLMTQILGGLITYLLLAIYCHENYREPVSIKRVRQLRIKIQNELRDSYSQTDFKNLKERKHNTLHAKT